MKAVERAVEMDWARCKAWVQMSWVRPRALPGRDKVDVVVTLLLRVWTVSRAVSRAVSCWSWLSVEATQAESKDLQDNVGICKDKGDGFFTSS